MIQGCMKLLSEDQLDLLNSAVIELLETTGCRIDHEEVRSLLSHRGAEVDEVTKVVRFPKVSILEVLDWQRENNPRAINQSDRPYSTMGGIHVYVYDWKSKSRWRPDTKMLLDLVHMGDSLSEISRVGAPVINSEVDPRFESIETMALMLKNTRKPGGMEVIYPEHVEYMARIGGIYSDKDFDGKFIDDSNFTTSPLIMTRRMLGCLIQKTKFNIPCVTGSQPVSGISSPVTLAGTVALGCAEIIAGWIVGKTINPNVALGGIICSGSLDMKTTEVCFSSPEAVLQDACVIQMFEDLYGGGVISGSSYIDAKTPNAQAAFEKAFKKIALRINMGLGGDFTIGTLDAGAVFSPVQAMLDIDFNGVMWRYLMGVEVSQETIALEVIDEVGIGGNFLETSHTLEHFRKNWYPSILDRQAWDEIADEVGGDEQLIINAEEKWREAIARYEPFDLKPYKAKAIDKVVEEARENLYDLVM